MSSAPESVDVAILGGGPAGAATGIKIRQQNPSLSIALIEQSSHHGQKIGESLPPGADSLLKELGAWQEFQKLHPRPVYGIQSSWATPVPTTNDFLFQASGNGWVIDRQLFDQSLVQLARDSGVHYWRQSRFINARNAGRTAWDLEFKSTSGRRHLRAGFVVDATGRKASFARLQQASSISYDHLVAIHGIFSCVPKSPTLIEPFEMGWWYSASLPNGNRIVSCFVDADEAANLKNEWLIQLNRTRNTRLAIGDASLTSDLKTCSANSRKLDQATGKSWLAVGDAASTYDPLSSQGIFKGLRSGIFAAYALSAPGNRDRELKKYQQFIDVEFESYLETKAHFYQEETRWPDSPFWKNRNDHIHLDPQTILLSTQIQSRRTPLFLTRSQANLIQQECSSPTPAHRLVSHLQSLFTSIPTNHVILGIQNLIQSGQLSTQPHAIAC